MRKHRVCYVGALGLALAVAVPATAMASGIQNNDSVFSPQKNANLGLPAPTVNLSGKFSKNGTIREHLFLSNIVGSPPALQTVDIHAPEELKFTTKKLKKCDPAAIGGQTPDAARAACRKAQIGQGQTAAFGIPGAGEVTLFNGTKQNGNPTVLFHTFTANVPIVLVSEIRNSPLGSPYGKVFHTPVSTAVGGGVPPGIVIEDTDYTISKTWTVKKGKRKKKVSWVTGKCTDGALETRVDFIHAPPEPTQSPADHQECTK
jgi:hypothetical protein